MQTILLLAAAVAVVIYLTTRPKTTPQDPPVQGDGYEQQGSGGSSTQLGAASQVEPAPNRSATATGTTLAKAPILTLKRGMSRSAKISAIQGTKAGFKAAAIGSAISQPSAVNGPSVNTAGFGAAIDSLQSIVVQSPPIPPIPGLQQGAPTVNSILAAPRKTLVEQILEAKVCG